LGPSIQHFLDISRPGVSIVEVIFQSIGRMLELHCSLVHALAVSLLIPMSVFQVFVKALSEALGIAFHSAKQLLEVVVAHPVRLVLRANARRRSQRCAEHQTDCYYDKPVYCFPHCYPPLVIMPAPIRCLKAGFILKATSIPPAGWLPAFWRVVF